MTARNNQDADARRAKFDFPPIDKEKAYTIVDVLAKIGKNHGASPARVALAWLLAKGKDIIPIPGTKHEKYLAENLGALEIELTASEISELDKLYGLVKGNRYDDNSMRNTLR